MQKIKNFWVVLRSSLWFVPGLMVTASIALALILIEVDGRIDGKWLLEYPRLFGVGSEGSRGMLTAIAGSMLTVAALAFSMTLSALTQASAQYTPRILRNFMRDRVNQFILGYFVSVFAYCLVVLRTIRGADEIKFVPSLAVLVGLVLAIGGIVVLIYFIHHIASSLQVSQIIDNIVEETKEAIDSLFPKELGKAAEEAEKTEAQVLRASNGWREIPARESGYIQQVDTENLIEFAEENEFIIKMERGIGQFIGEGATLVSLTEYEQNSEMKIDDQTEQEINELFSINRYRTIEQDVGYGIRQIVDIALKALSPGVNDTTTAVTCIDFLGVIVGEIARRRLPERVRVKDGKPRVFAKVPNFEDYVETAFDQIRISGKGNQAIFERLLGALIFVSKNTQSENRHAVVREQIDLIEEFAEQTLETDYEKQKVRQKIAETRQAFNK
ncbi:MAG: DUF2254 domain-containing protein [Acidobacteria bacterium]|jgi:uncharacterized membrane protein|nr:DUF2254 domain-containing protein [Acidobacteriota bacterium]